MANRNGVYRAMVNFIFGDGIPLGLVGDIRTFSEWAIRLNPLWPTPDPEQALNARIDLYDGSSPTYPLWLQEVTAGTPAFPVDGEFHVAAAVLGLVNARIAVAAADIVPNHSVANQVTWDLTDTGTPVGTFANAEVTVDSKGRIVNISAGSGAPGATWGSITGTITDQTDLMATFAAILHAPTHKIGGSDEILLDEFGTPTDNTNLNATTTEHGLLRKLSGNNLEYLDGTGNFSVPAGGGGGGGSMDVFVGVDTLGGVDLVGPDWVDMSFDDDQIVDAAYTRPNSIEVEINDGARYELGSIARVILDTANTILRVRFMVDTGAGYVPVDQPEAWGYNDGASPNNQSVLALAIVTLNATDRVKVQCTSNTGTDPNDTIAAGSAFWIKKLVAGGGGGATDFTDLGDVPGSYAGASLQVVRVNVGETGLEFATVAGTGDVVGPASAVNNNIVLFDGVTGKLIKDGLGTSTGGNQAADAGKAALFGSSGSLTAIADGTVGAAGISAAIIGGVDTNAAISAQAFDAFGVRSANESTTRPSLEAVNDDATNAGPIAHFHNNAGLGAEMANDGGLAWTSPTGAATTRTGLGLGGLAVLGAAPAGTLTGATLAAGVTASSLTSVGTIATGVWNGTDIAVADGGTGSSTAAGALTNLGAEAAANTQRVVLSADFTTNSATFVDVTGFAVTIPAGETWFVQIDGAYQSTNASTGVGVSITRTGSPTRSNFERRIYTTATTNVMSGSVGNIDDVGPLNTTVDTINADRHWIMTGVVVAGASPCVIQVRAGRGGSANNVSIMAGAIIIAHKIA